jgi:hypothetical protein
MIQKIQSTTRQAKKLERTSLLEKIEKSPGIIGNVATAQW